MRYFKYITGCLLFLSLFFQSCSDDRNTLNHQGFLELGVSKNVEVITRGFDVEDQSLSVDICSGKDGSVVKHFSDYNDMAGERVLLEVGSYTIKVKSNPISKLDFEKPTFYGEKSNVSVTAGKTTSASVECSLSCVKVTTEFTKPVKEKFESITARISDSSSSYLDYSMEETRAGYFQPGYLLVDLTLTNKEGLEFKMSKLIENTEERDYYHLIFDLIDSGDNNSGMDFDISIETNPTNDEEHTVTVPLPGTGYEQDPPIVNIIGAENESTIIIPQEEQTSDKYNISISGQSQNIGIKKVLLMTQNTSEQFASIPQILTLSELSMESEEYKILSSLGFNFPSDYSDIKSEFIYEFTPSKLLLPGDYKFALLFQDLNGKITSAEFTYSIKAEISTEDIEDQNEYVWSKFAQLRGYAANPQLGGYFKYKKSSSQEWFTTNKASFTDKFAYLEVNNLSPETEYNYMFCQGDVEGEIKTFKTDTETDIPNLSLDEWSDQYTPGGWWDSGNSGTKTLNLYPTLKDNGVSGSSVKMFTSYFSGTVFGLVKVDKLVAGNLFIGNYEGLSGTEGVKLNFGHEYNSRPYKLNFKYKYASAKINVINNNRGSETDENDSGFIYFLLTDKIYNIDTTKENTFIKEENYSSDDHILAYGSFTISESVNDFQSGEICLTYKTLDKKPTHIIIVASSSKKGDYFTGGEGSTLWLDDLELVYPNSIEEIK